MITLSELGWTSFFEDQLTPHDRGPDRFPCRVTAQHKQRYILLAPHGEHDAEISGKLRHHALGASNLPAVGDWVVARFAPGAARIERVLQRATAVSRKRCGETRAEQVLAANADNVFCVSALDREFNPRRIERYLASVRHGGAQPVVVLNKADLCDAREQRAAEARALAGDAPVHLLSALSGELSALAPYLGPGRTVALLGSSGAGKSTLLNRLLGAERQATTRVRADDDRGRHTTTHRELFRLPCGSLAIDTPGLRELHLWDAGEGLDATFDELGSLLSACRFRDCSHDGEPGCAVEGALDSGTLDPARWASHRKLQRELDHMARRTDPELARERQRRWKKVAQTNRKRDKHRRWD